MVSEEQVHAEKEWKRRLSHPNIHQKPPEEDQPGKERPDHPEGTESGDPEAQGADKPGEEEECGTEGKPPDTDTEAPVVAEAVVETEVKKEERAVETKEENTAESGDNAESKDTEAKSDD